MITLWFLAIAAYSQKYDYVWLMGQNSQMTIEHSGTIIDFSALPPDISYEFRDMNFLQVNASICDTAGNLLFYTNGIYIANALGEPMQNGFGLNPGPHAETWQDYGYILDQGAMVLPVPENTTQFYVLHMDKELDESIPTLYSKHFYYSLIDMSEGGGLGAVLQKNKVILENYLDQGKLTAIRHANGRDWWVLARKYGTNQYFRISISIKGIQVLNIQETGSPIPSNSIGQAVFSPDGTKYASINVAGIIGDPIHVNIYDFDRCSGQLSNQVQFTYADTASCAGIAISPNSRFLYVSSFRYLYQYDLWASDIEA
ncbi:MAG: hypothetical protein HUU34_23225, partial [Saprospiraceae bacterium]|nr:hypothetical protein [Saprospiraceae bacterium]